MTPAWAPTRAWILERGWRRRHRFFGRAFGGVAQPVIHPDHGWRQIYMWHSSQLASRFMLG